MVVFFGFVWAGMFRTCSCKPLVSDGAVLLFVLLNIFVVPFPPLGVVGRYFSGECSLKCRRGWASGDLSSSSILAQDSVTPLSAVESQLRRSFLQVQVVLLLQVQAELKLKLRWSESLEATTVAATFALAPTLSPSVTSAHCWTDAGSQCLH